MKKLNRGDIINLFELIRDIKNSNLQREALIKYVMLRVKMKGVTDEFITVRQEISEQTKPENWKEGDSTEKWDEAFRPVMQKWLDEEVDIDTKIFTEEDCIDLITSNPDKSGVFSDAILEYMKL